MSELKKRKSNFIWKLKSWQNQYEINIIHQSWQVAANFLSFECFLILQCSYFQLPERDELVVLHSWFNGYWWLGHQPTTPKKRSFRWGAVVFSWLFIPYVHLLKVVWWIAILVFWSHFSFAALGRTIPLLHKIVWIWVSFLEKLLSVGSYLCSTPCLNEPLDFLPIFPE